MSTVDEMMKEVEVSGRLRDGGTCTVKANKMHAERLNLEGGLFHPFERADGTTILFMLEDGDGTVFTSPSNKKGVSLPALIWGKKGKVSYVDNNPFNNTMMNFDSRKEAVRKKKFKGYRM